MEFLKNVCYALEDFWKYNSPFKMALCKHLSRNPFLLILKQIWQILLKSEIFSGFKESVDRWWGHEEFEFNQRKWKGTGFRFYSFHLSEETTK